MTTFFRTAFMALALCSLVARAGTARAGFDELLRWTPSDANAIVVLRVADMHESPLALREGWKNKHAQAFSSAPMLVPPLAQRFVMGVKLELGGMTPKWEVAVMDFAEDAPASRIADVLGGSVESLAGFDAVLAKNGLYAVKLAPRTVGAMVPGHRQDVSRWLRETKDRKQPALSPYLRQAASYADTVGTEVILAVDLEDVISPAVAQGVVDQSTVLKSKKKDAAKIVELLAGIRGVTIGVRVGEKAFGRLKVDFSGDPAILADVAKPLLLEVLAEAGAMIDEFQDWKPRVESRLISIEGDLTPVGMRRLFSVVEFDSSAVATKKQPAATGQSSASRTPYVSQAYFAAVTKTLDDLKLQKAVTMGQIGLWLDKAAKKIDRMPILDVDPELVDYAAGTANQLRAAVASIQGIGIQSGAREAQITPSVAGTVGGSTTGPVAQYGTYGYQLYGASSSYGSFDIRNISSERRAIRAEEKAKGATAAREIMRQIDSESAAIRRKMTTKYRLNF